MNKQFKVIFTGNLRPHTDPETFVTEFSRRFNMPVEKARQLMAANREMVIKQGLPQKQAEAYVKVLEGLGMIVRLEPMEPPVKKTVPTEEPNAKGTAEAAGAVTPAKPAAGAAANPGGTKNPYAMPQATLVEEPEEGEMTGPVPVPAGNGWMWLRQGFWHFRQSPLAWILTLLAWMVILMVANFIPLIGPLAINIFGPVFIAGFMLGAREQEQGGTLQFGHLFRGFSTNLGQLVLVGVIYLVGFIVIGIVMAIIFGTTFAALGGLEAAQGQDPQAMLAAMGGISTIILLILVVMALMIPLLMAYWFAPALVVVDGLSAVNAMKLSFKGCLKNILPFLVYGLIGLMLTFVAALPFFLGFLVVGPMFIASIYVAYRDIFYG